MFRTEEKIDAARAFINSRPLEERKYWETITHDPIEQGFRASAVLNKRGDIQITTYTPSASDVSQHQFGLRGEEENKTTYGKCITRSLMQIQRYLLTSLIVIYTHNFSLSHHSLIFLSLFCTHTLYCIYIYIYIYILFNK